MRNLQLFDLEGITAVQFVGHHFVAVWTKGRWGTFLSAAAVTAAAAAATAIAIPAAAATAVAAAAATATATAVGTIGVSAVLGHGREEVSVLFYDEIELLALGFKFRT